GYQTSSASSSAIQSPSAASIPALRDAAALPKFTRNSLTGTLAFSISKTEASVEPSSMTIISPAGWVCLATLCNAVPTQRPALRHGKMTEIRIRVMERQDCQVAACSVQWYNSERPSLRLTRGVHPKACFAFVVLQ